MAANAAGKNWDEYTPEEQKALGDSLEERVKKDPWQTKTREAQESAQQTALNDQAVKAGVNVGSTQTSAGGAGGFFGEKEGYRVFTPETVEDQNYQANKDAVGAQIAGLDKRQNSQMTSATLNQGASNQVRQRQMGLADALTAASNGQGPSAAQDQFRLATNRSLADSLALARSGKGNQAAAMKQAQLTNAGTSQNAAAQSGMLAAQEQNAARAQLGSVLSDTRGQDLGAASTNAAMQQQTGVANLQAGVDQQRMKDQLTQQYLAMGMSLDQAKMQADVQQKQFTASLLAQQEAAAKGVSIQNAAQGIQVAGAIAGAAASGGASIAGSAVEAAADDKATKSDRRAKKNIGDGDDDVKAFLDDLVAHTFEYKNKSQDGGGRRLGIMAQDAEKSGMGRGLVTNTTGGKMIDNSRAVGAALAGLANINKRLSAVERG